MQGGPVIRVQGVQDRAAPEQESQRLLAPRGPRRDVQGRIVPGVAPIGIYPDIEEKPHEFRVQAFRQRGVKGAAAGSWPGRRGGRVPQRGAGPVQGRVLPEPRLAKPAAFRHRRWRQPQQAAYFARCRRFLAVLQRPAELDRVDAPGIRRPWIGARRDQRGDGADQTPPHRFVKRGCFRPRWQRSEKRRPPATRKRVPRRAVPRRAARSRRAAPVAAHLAVRRHGAEPRRRPDSRPRRHATA